MRLATRNPNGVPGPFNANDFDAFVSRVFGHDLGGAGGRYPVDVREDGDTLHIDAELPGFTKDQVDVTVDNDVLTITAERPEPQQVDENVAWHLRERRGGRVERAFKLPNTLDYASVEGAMSDGVLHVTLKKRPEAKPRKIAIG